MEHALTTLLVMGLQATILAVIILAFRGIFKKTPKIYIYSLWLVMLVRLITPVIFESNYGITPSPEQLTISATNEGILSSGVDKNALADSNMSNTSSTNEDTNLSATVPSAPTTDSSANSGDVTSDTNTSDSTVIPTTPVKQQTPFWKQTWFLPAVCSIWCFGTIVVLSITAFLYLAMKRKLRFAIRIEDNIWECETVNSPFVMGIIRPKIYLPVALSEDEREYILSHERMHIKHFDHIIRLVMTLAIALHWWNPIVWIAMNLMKKDMEMLCDEAATTKQEPNYRKEYSLVLLKYAAKNSGLSPVVSFGESNTAGRVKHLMFLKKPKLYMNFAIVIAMSLCLVSCMAQGAIDTEDNSYDDVLASIIPEETVTLNFYSELSSFHGIQEGWFADIMKEKFNVELQIIDSYTKDNSSSKQTYDIIAYGSSYSYDEDMASNALLCLDKANIKTYMPYIHANLSNSYVYDDNNAIYAIYTSTSLDGDSDPVYFTWDMRFDYYEELGKPTIVSLDDWINVLAQMQTNHPTDETGNPTYAITYPNELDDGKIWGISTFVTGYYGYESHGMGYYDWENDTYYGLLSTFSDGSYGPYLKMLQLNNQLYRAGLLDPDVDTQSWDDAISKIEKGQSLGSVASFLGSQSNNYMYPVTPQEANTIAYSLGHSQRRVAIGADTQYPELCMAIINYLYSPEGMMTQMYGPKDECWYYDEEGYAHLTELGEKCITDGHDTLVHGKSYYEGCPMFNIVAYNVMATNTDSGECYNYEYWKNTIAEPIHETETAWRNWSGYNSVEHYMQTIEPDYVLPAIDYLDTTETDLSENFDAVYNIIASMSWEAIKAPDEATFGQIIKDMVDLATQAGYEECVEYSENYIKNQTNTLK